MSKHAHVKTRHCAFVMAYLPMSQCWATWREESNGYRHGASIELHETRGEASKRLEERVTFQRQVEG